ncbi:MAG: hypothetical protein ACR2OZ_21020 [Verrucomicrobiales bacterium]
MSRWFKTACRRLVADEGISHARWEMIIMRLLLATVMFDLVSKAIDLSFPEGGMSAAKLGQLSVIPEVAKFKGQPHPNGIAHFVDLTFLSDPGIARPIYYGFYAALALYVLGIGLPMATTYLFLALLVHGTFHNSQGSVHHHLQVLTLVLGVQCLAAWRGLLSQFSERFIGGYGGSRYETEDGDVEGDEARRRLPPWCCEFLRSSDWTMAKMTDWTRQAIVAAYVVSALSKIWMTKGLWIWKVPRLGVQLRKSADQDYYDTLSHSTTAHEWLPEWCLTHPWAARMVFGPSLLIELFFFLALRNRRIAGVYAAVLIGFHQSVSLLMSLDFRYNVQLLLIYFVNIPFWLWSAGRWLRMRPDPIPVAEAAAS